MLDGRLGHLLLAEHVVSSRGDGQGNAGQEQQAAAGFVDHGAEALLLEPGSTKKEAHACNDEPTLRPIIHVDFH